MTQKRLLPLAIFLAFGTTLPSAVAEMHHSEDDGHTVHVAPPKGDYSMMQLHSTSASQGAQLKLHFDALNMELMAGPASTPLKVRIDQLTNFSTTLKNRIYDTRDLLDAIFESEEFYQAIINHTYNGKKTFVDNRGYSNKQIYEMIQAGKEKFSRSIDRTMNLKLKLYYENSSTVGWTYSNSEIINVNEKFYRNYTPSKIARNLTHEWLHNVGFSHDAKVTTQRNYSVPYAVGNIVERLAKKYK